MAAGLIISALQQLDPRLRVQMLGLGASNTQMVLVLWKEARLPMFAAIIAAFGSVISEVGASMMVGGNLEGHTRVLTTAIVLEASRGIFASAIALSLILIGIAFLVNLALTTIQQRNRNVETLLEIRGLVMKAGKTTILDLPSLDVYKNEVLILLGPNGAGKSTLLRAAAGLIKPTAGSIRFKDEPHLTDLEFRRKVSTVFQSPLLLTDTVSNNIATGLGFRGLSEQRSVSALTTGWTFFISRISRTGRPEYSLVVKRNV
jgi:hypothetical protein